jgi:hypothetical protein
MESNTLCPICLDDLYTKETFSEIDPCRHVLCELCFNDLIRFSRKCPLCSSAFLKAIVMNLSREVLHNREIGELEIIITEKGEVNLIQNHLIALRGMKLSRS